MPKTVGLPTPEATATLVLEEPPFSGAEVETRLSLSPAIYFGTRQWLDQATTDGGTTDQLMLAAREVASLFAEHGLVRWNLLYAHGPKAGEPMPATVDGLLGLDVRLLFRIISTWMSSIGSVPIPLPATPTAGAESAGRKRKRSTSGPSNAATPPRPSIVKTSDGSSGSGVAA